MGARENETRARDSKDVEVFSSLPEAAGLCHSYSYGLRAIIQCLPAWCRFIQCLRRYRDTKRAFPHLLNAGKYSTTFFVVTFAALYATHRGKTHKHALTHGSDRLALKYDLTLVSMLIPGAFIMKMVCQIQLWINKPPLSQHGLQSGSGITKEEQKKGRSNTIEREECSHLTSARVKV